MLKSSFINALSLLLFSSLIYAPDHWVRTENSKASDKLGEGEFASVYYFTSPEYPNGAAIKLYKPDGSGANEKSNISLKQLNEYYEGYKLLESALGEKAVKVYGMAEYNGMRGIVMELLPENRYQMNVGSLRKHHAYINATTADEWHEAMDQLIENKIYNTDYNVAILPNGKIKFFDGDFAFRWNKNRTVSEDRATSDMQSTRDEVMNSLIKDNHLPDTRCKFGLRKAAATAASF